jgi:hypothetical protein
LSDVTPREARYLFTAIVAVAAGCSGSAGDRQREAVPAAGSAPVSQAVPLTAAATAGCFQFVDSAGRAVPSPFGFWAAPVRLDTVREVLAGAGEDGGVPGIYAVRATAVIADARDTMMFRTSWQIVSPDTLVVRQGTRFVGDRFRLRPRGRDFAGLAEEYNDAGRAASVLRPIVARRVDCPAPRVSGSRPSA